MSRYIDADELVSILLKKNYNSTTGKIDFEDVIYLVNSQPTKINYCRFCNNAVVNPELDSDTDLAYMGVGHSRENTGMFIRSGNGQPTVIIVSQWDEKTQRNRDVATYQPKCCPECGRRLIENEEKEREQE